MRARSLLPFAALLALTACGEEQTAEAPATANPPAATETAQAPVSSTAPATRAQTTPPPAAGETTGATTSATSTGSTQTAATSTTSLDSFQGRTYSAGPVSLQLNRDNSFVMNEVSGNRKVEGRYAFENGIVTFSDPKGDIGQAQFPMRCRLETVGSSEFRLADAGGACTPFKDMTFKPTAG